jgi:methylated-DNA-protein-cysteine methyltransferase related protein
MKKTSSQNKEEIYEAIYEIVRLIPKGKVSSYGAIAAAIGLSSGARIVGYAMSQAGTARPPVPAHRVVNSSGLLTGKFHFSPPEKMELMLKKEKVMVRDDKVVDFRMHFWDPLAEL